MNLPNRISLTRLLLVPVMVTFFLLDAYIPCAQLIGAAIFVLASITDGLDGNIARRLNQVTTLGKFLDSIADKVLCMVALVLIVYAAPMYQVFVVVLTCITIAREFLISALRQIAAANNVIMAADKLGKVKAIFQYVSFPLVMAAADLSGLFNIDVVYLYTTGFVLFGLSTVFALISAVNYLYINRAVFLSGGDSEKK